MSSCKSTQNTTTTTTTSTASQIPRPAPPITPVSPADEDTTKSSSPTAITVNAHGTSTSTTPPITITPPINIDNNNTIPTNLSASLHPFLSRDALLNAALDGLQKLAMFYDMYGEFTVEERTRAETVIRGLETRRRDMGLFMGDSEEEDDDYEDEDDEDDEEGEDSVDEDMDEAEGKGNKKA